MAPHLVRTRSAYKGIRILISYHTHTHTHYKIIHALLVMGWYNEKKTTDQYAEKKRWIFTFDLQEESEDEYLTERGIVTTM